MFITVIGFLFLIKYIIQSAKQTHIKAEFVELTPFSKKMPVYFKGFKIGKVTKIEPKDDFTSSYMYITFFPKKLNLPENILIQLRSYKKNLTYAEVILPETPSVKKLKTGSIVQGKTNSNLNSIIEKQLENGSFDAIFLNIGEITTHASGAMKELNDLLRDLRVIFKNNESYISVSTRNISQATSHLSKTSVNISSSIDQKTLDKTMKNLEVVTGNLKNITKNVDCATRNLSETMENVNGISENVNGITNSINCTLKSRFGGLRLIFGKTDQNCKCAPKKNGK